MPGLGLSLGIGLTDGSLAGSGPVFDPAWKTEDDGYWLTEDGGHWLTE